MSRRKPILKNRTPAEVEEAVVAIALEQPAWGQVRVAEAVKRRGLSLSPAGGRCGWQRHGLETMKKRLKALEAKSAEDGLVLTEARSPRSSGPGLTMRPMASSRASAPATAARRTPSMSAP